MTLYSSVEEYLKQQDQKQEGADTACSAEAPSVEQRLKRFEEARRPITPEFDAVLQKRVAESLAAHPEFVVQALRQADQTVPSGSAPEERSAASHMLVYVIIRTCTGSECPGANGENLKWRHEILIPYVVLMNPAGLPALVVIPVGGPLANGAGLLSALLGLFAPCCTKGINSGIGIIAVRD